MVVEFSGGAPCEGSQQQDCEQARSSQWVTEEHLCRLTDHVLKI